MILHPGAFAVGRRSIMDDARVREAGRLAIATRAVAAGSVACLITFLTVVGPFGPITAVGNAATGVLSGMLAWQLRDRIQSRTGKVAVSSAVVGAALAVAGAGLVLSGTTGFFLAGLVSSVG